MRHLEWVRSTFEEVSGMIMCRETLDGWMAWVTGWANYYGLGVTPKEAIGDLVIKHPQVVGLETVEIR